MADHITGIFFALFMAAFGLYNCHENNAFVWGFLAFVAGIVLGLRFMRLLGHEDASWNNTKT